ncbi:hypothetical protein UA32_12595 [Photobacterium angustum]|uniref:Porin family protein n=1 Tax=Photobacterium angustum TaxID=661 RepID=A0ABX5H179_PHOAN|nr:outer membrane beta-barrel protein [Photobacterium angustum]KJG37784.1 hypothetical protein UA32_12595 [Photobacterium angustum]PSX07054.1 porin family protein [Photobacterium angustum]
MRNGIAVGFMCLFSTASFASTNSASSIGLKVGVSDVTFTALNEKKSSSGIEYGIDYTWLNYFYKNVSLGLNLTASRFENQLYGNEQSDHSAVIVSPIISYRFLTVSPEFLGVKHLRFHDGLSVYFKIGLGYAKSKIANTNISMEESGAVGSFGAGFKFQTTGHWAFAIEYNQIDNKLWGMGSRDYGISNSSLLGSLSYRF